MTCILKVNYKARPCKLGIFDNSNIQLFYIKQIKHVFYLYIICANSESICHVRGLNRDTLRHIGEKIRLQREALAFSMIDVANMTDLTVNTIASIEKGGNFSMNNFLLVCKALTIQPRDIFDKDIDLTPLYELPPMARRRLQTTQKLDELVYHSEFFAIPRRVSEVILETQGDRRDSNKYSVYLSNYCKEGELQYIKEGNIKRYIRKK